MVKVTVNTIDQAKEVLFAFQDFKGNLEIVVKENTATENSHKLISITNGTMVSSEVLLREADRDAVIKELKERVSITSIFINKGTGANIISMHGNVALSGESYIFVIKPENKELPNCVDNSKDSNI